MTCQLILQLSLTFHPTLASQPGALEQLNRFPPPFAPIALLRKSTLDSIRRLERWKQEYGRDLERIVSLRKMGNDSEALKKTCTEIREKIKEIEKRLKEREEEMKDQDKLEFEFQSTILPYLFTEICATPIRACLKWLGIPGASLHHSSKR